MSNDSDKQDEGQPENEQQEGEPFDAVAAAAELDASIAEAEAQAQAAPSPEADKYIAMLEQDIEALNVIIKQKDVLLDKADKRSQHLLDEIEKSKTRVEKEHGKILERRSRKVLLSFLEVLDDLDRAIEHARAMDHNPEVMAGVEIVRASFLKTLAEYGVALQDAQGQPFDPNQHEAVTSVPVTDAAQHGVVVGVIRAGYVQGELALRPARVAVGKSS